MRRFCIMEICSGLSEINQGLPIFTGPGLVHEKCFLGALVMCLFSYFKQTTCMWLIGDNKSVEDTVTVLREHSILLYIYICNTVINCFDMFAWCKYDYAKQSTKVVKCVFVTNLAFLCVNVVLLSHFKQGKTIRAVKEMLSKGRVSM